MKYSYTLLITVVLLTLPLPIHAEYVFTLDGAIHKGAIKSESAASITILTDEKKRETYKRTNVIRVLYTELNMGKILVQRKNGENFTAYMVDEDRESYTFRRDLFKPEEFRLERKEVLFIAERNPSGLKGEADTTTIKLTWYHPYDKMKKYNIYTKKEKGGKYELAATSGSNKYTLENLPSNRHFFIVVTGIDPRNDETPYSNEIEVTTKNILPLKPEEAEYITDPPGNKVISWKPSVDPDGSVDKYRVYVTSGKEKKLMGEVKNTAFTIKPDVKFDKIYVSAVDNLGDESNITRAYESCGQQMRIAFYPGVIFPMGDFGDIAGTGYGGTFSFSLYNYLFKGFTVGIETGCYYLTGKDAIDTRFSKTDSMVFIPFMITTGYNFTIGEKLSVIPFITGGGAYLYSKYTSRDEVTYLYSNKTLSEGGPAAGAGIEFEYRMSNSVYISLRGTFGYLTGADSGMYSGCSAGIIHGL